MRDAPEMPCPDPSGGPGCERPGRLARVLRRLPALAGLVLLVGAIVVVTREFRHLRLSDIVVAIRHIPPRAELLAAGWTLAAYFVLTFYDRLATRYAGRPLAWRRTAFASFTAYVLSHNLGFSALSGGAVRFRLYTAWGLTPAQIARVVGFCSLTFLLGAVSIGGAVALFAPAAVPLAGAGRSLPAVRAIGLLMWLSVIAYVVLSSRFKQIRLGRHVILLPGWRMAVRQVALAATDVSTTAAIAFTLLPYAPHLTYPRFLTIYLASYSAGLLASVPGGLGVFETAMLLGLHDDLPAPAILGSVLVFRLYYYIVPLFVAGAMFAGHEVYLRGVPSLGRRRPRAGGASRVIRASEADFSVAVATGLTALSGAALVAIGALDPPRIAPPAFPATLALLASHAGSYALSLIGTALMAISLGLSQRVTLAWVSAIVLLGFGSVICLVEQLAPVVAGAALLAALLMMPFRRSYYRPARLLARPFEPGTALTVFALAGSVFALTWLEPQFRYLDRSAWWQLVLSGALPDRLRLVMVLLVGVLLLATWTLVRPGPVSWRVWDETCRRRFRSLGGEPPEDAEGVVYGEGGQSCIAFRRLDGVLLGLGDPAGLGHDRISAIWRLRDLAVQEGRTAAVWGAGSELVATWGALGLTAWPNGGGFVCCADEAGWSALVREVREKAASP